MYESLFSRIVYHIVNKVTLQSYTKYHKPVLEILKLLHLPSVETQMNKVILVVSFVSLFVNTKFNHRISTLHI